MPIIPFMIGLLCAFAAVIVLWVKLAGRTRLTWRTALAVIVALLLGSWA